MIGIDDIRAAAQTIAGRVHATPLIHSRSFSAMTGADVYLKAENLQKTGSFKVRGAFAKLGSLRDGRVIAASMGNHAQGVAYAASALGLQSRIVMPLTAPIVKQEATKGYGAELILHGESFQEALDHARSQTDFTFVHAFDDDAIIAGQGTVALEILQDLEQPDIILVPVGGGGLISGIACAVKALSPKTEVIGVQTVAAPSAFRSFRQKTIVTAVPAKSIADGISVGTVGSRPYEMMQHFVDDMLVIDEDAISLSVLLFMERKKLVVEGAGAVPLAALLRESSRFRGRKVVLVVSGGNIDFSLVDRIIHKGLVTSGRTAVFEVTLDDLPGRLNALTSVIARHQGNVLDISHDRLAPDLAVGETKVVFTIETRGMSHLDEIISGLEELGVRVRKR